MFTGGPSRRPLHVVKFRVYRMSGRFQKEARLKRILNGDDGFKLTKCAQDALYYRLNRLF